MIENNLTETRKEVEEAKKLLAEFAAANGTDHQILIILRRIVKRALDSNSNFDYVADVFAIMASIAMENTAYSPEYFDEAFGYWKYLDAANTIDQYIKSCAGTK